MSSSNLLRKTFSGSALTSGVLFTLLSLATTASAAPVEITSPDARHVLVIEPAGADVRCQVLGDE